MWEAVKHHVREVGVPVGEGGREVSAAVLASRLGLGRPSEWATIRLLIDAALVLEASRWVGVA